MTKKLKLKLIKAKQNQLQIYFLKGITSTFNINIGKKKSDGGVLVNGQWRPIGAYANGCLSPVGQMFVARENGPELVGRINGNTVVMNNDQIVACVSDDV